MKCYESNIECGILDAGTKKEWIVRSIGGSYRSHDFCIFFFTEIYSSPRTLPCKVSWKEKSFIGRKK